MATESELVQIEGAVLRKLKETRKSGRFRHSLANDAYYATRTAIAEYEKLLYKDFPAHTGELPAWAK